MSFQATQIDHVSVVVTNVERSRRFYREILGLKEIAKPKTFGFVALWFDLGNQQLHLLLKEKADTHSPRHFALRVKDASSARAYLREHGIQVENATLIADCERFFIYDPDGNRVEVIQWIRPYDPDVAGAEVLDQ